MDNIINFLVGSANFNETGSRLVKPLLARLGREGQSPDALFITCADSRIDPSLITQSLPGDLFILRNIGNLVPLADTGDSSVLATVEYALGALNVSTIIICGHSDCGAMKVVAANKDLSTMPHAQEWLQNADASLADFNSTHDTIIVPDDLPEHDRLSQVNVVGSRRTPCLSPAPTRVLTQA